MNTFDKKNHEKQSSKTSAHLFDLHLSDHKSCCSDSMDVKLKLFNDEKEHGISRSNYQSDNRCNHSNLIPNKCYFRNNSDRVNRIGWGVFIHKLYQLLPLICNRWFQYLQHEKDLSSLNSRNTNYHDGFQLQLKTVFLS